MQTIEPRALLEELIKLRAEVHREGQAIFAQWRPDIQRRSFLISGSNLACYMALRRRDLRPLQAALIPFGLSSLGRSEARVMANLDAVISTLADVCRAPDLAVPKRPPLHVFYRGQRILEENTRSVLGTLPERRRVAIMVTLPTEAADDYPFVLDLLQRGMNCARINCAHDDPDIWHKMIINIRQAEQEAGMPCKVMMDLGGPKARLGEVITPEGKGRLYEHDRLLLTRSVPRPLRDYPFQAECLIPEALDQVKIGDTVWIDDGHLGAKVEAITIDGVVLRVVSARAKGFKLRPAKGLNFPDTELSLTPLTDKDCEDLNFVVEYADAVGYSYVQTAEDIERLQNELALRQKSSPPDETPAIIAKVETPRAMRNLPSIIVQAAGRHPFGVMIARGDLAVEIGYQRLAEIQEEILWLCEAAHVPVIWATQVLENFVKDGIPSRAEMTDAAMSERAECVMLNKGPFVAQAVTVLDDVLARMQDHQFKKTSQLRALRSW